jgi:MFS family permease
VVVFVSFAIIAMCASSYYITIVSLKSISAEFGWPRSFTSSAYSILFLGMGVGGIFMGWWSDRIGVALPAAVGIVMTAIGTIVASTSQSFVTFLIAHGILMGLLGNSALFVPLLANITHWFDRRRGLAVGIVATGQGVAGVIWIPVFTQVTEALGWRTTFLYYGAFLVCLLPATLVLRRRPPGTAKVMTASTVPIRTVHSLGMSPNLLVGLLSIAIVGCCVSMSIPTVHLVSHVTDLGFTRAQGAEVLALALACSIVSRLAWGWISDRIGGLLTLFTGSLLQAFAVFLFVLAQDITQLYLIGIYFGLAFGGIVPAYTIIMRHLLPATRIGMRIGIVLLFGTIGMALGSWLGGQFFDLSGHYADAFLTGVAANIVNLVIIGFLNVRYWQSQPRPEPV